MKSVEFRELHSVQDQDCFFGLRGADAVDGVPVFADVEVNVMGTLGLFAARVDQVTCGPVLYVFGRFVKHMPQTFSSVLLWVKVQHGQVHDWVSGASACCAILFLHLACRASSLLRSFRIACFSLGSLSGLSMGRVSSGLICVR
jgi:hypothetical protein